MIRITVATLLMAVAALAGAPHASAVAPSEYGWWWKGNQAQARPVILPPPPIVPEDGLYVAQDPDPNEPLAVAALNYLAPDGPSAVLELEVVPDSVSGTPLVAVCPLTSSFFGEQAGTWEQRPIPECGIALTTGELVEDGTILRVDLPGEFQVFPETWSFVLFPDDQANPFQIAFERPGEGSFEVNEFHTIGPTPPPATGPPPTFEAPPTFEPQPTFEPAPVLPAAPTTPAPTPVPEIELEEESARDTVSSAGTPAAPDDTAERILAVALLALMAAALGLVGWRGTPVFAGSGFSKSSEDGGLGRFSRPREGRPRGLL